MKLIYFLQNNNWFGTFRILAQQKNIFYEKLFFYKEKLVGYILEYPTEDKNKYSELIKKALIRVLNMRTNMIIWMLVICWI